MDLSLLLLKILALFCSSSLVFFSKHLKWSSIHSHQKCTFLSPCENLPTCKLLTETCFTHGQNRTQDLLKYHC